MARARVIIDRQSLDAFIHREFTARAQRAVALYRKTPLRLDAPDYPFARNPLDGSIRDEKSVSIRPIPGGVRVTVQSRGATFIEAGNQAGGQYINAPGGMALPLRPSSRGRGRAHSGRGSVVMGPRGPVLVVNRVRTYRGRRLLERSMRLAFTGRFGH